MAEDNLDNQLFTFDGGDVQIQLKFNGRRIIGSVNSTALSSAIPRWEENLTNCREEGVYLHFAKFDGLVLLILFRIAHFEFHALPTTMDVRLLYKLAGFCASEQCIHLVRPWMSTWTSMDAVGDFKVHAPKWFYVAWIFGLDELAATTSKWIFDNLTYNLKQKSYMISETAFFKHLPQFICASFEKTRRQAIRKILDVIYELVDRFMTTRRYFHGNISCDGMVCGTMILDLSRNNLWPKKAPKDIAESVPQLILLLEHILRNSILSPQRIADDDGNLCHRECSKSLLREASHNISEQKITDPLTERDWKRFYTHKNKGIKADHENIFHQHPSIEESADEEEASEYDSSDEITLCESTDEEEMQEE